MYNSVNPKQTKESTRLTQRAAVQKILSCFAVIDYSFRVGDARDARDAGIGVIPLKEFATIALVGKVLAEIDHTPDSHKKEPTANTANTTKIARYGSN